jgi:transcriptional regulator with XRE-family HTH domain
VKKVTPDMDFAAEIRQRRTNLGMTQKRACELAGVDPGGWSHMELKSQGAQVTLGRAAKIASGVGLVLVLMVDEDFKG